MAIGCSGLAHCCAKGTIGMNLAVVVVMEDGNKRDYRNGCDKQEHEDPVDHTRTKHITLLHRDAPLPAMR
jgi:hypothetical protein